MRLHVTSVFVDDQAKALEFYTTKLGFEKKMDVPVGEYRWLTVVSPEQRDGVELLLEPSNHPAVKPYREALVNDGIALASFEVDDIESECQRLKSAGRENHDGPGERWGGDDSHARRHLRQPRPTTPTELALERQESPGDSRTHRRKPHQFN